VLPEPYIEEFAKLQDEVPPAPFGEVRQTIEGDIGKIAQVFESFDDNAISGASLGQVYRARYRGKDVVVKVSRPDARGSVEVDTKVFKRLVPLVGRFIDPSLQFSAESVVDQFSETIQEEMNYKTEAGHLLQLRRALRDQKDVIIPNVFPEISSERVLVLENVGGIKVTDVAALDEEGIDRRRLARRVAKLFLKMLLSEEIFHADPHPGNISITPQGKIVLYDFGMIGRLDPETRTKLIRFYLALAQADPSKVVEMMLELGVLQPDTNRYVIRRGVELAMADMQGRKVEETEVKALMEIANRTIYQFPFKLPKNLVLYLRMFSILEGVCLALDPQFRFVHILRALLEEEGLVEEAYRRDIQRVIERVAKAIDASIEVAPLLKEFLERYPSTNPPPAGGTSGRRWRPFLAGLFAGIGAAGLSASIYFVGSTIGRLGLLVSLALLAGASVAFSR
jgi:predicted unusual protein kinase regulating ubiquinone biosynthesis (AarF/ABC1/UbiB family)